MALAGPQAAIDPTKVASLYRDIGGGMRFMRKLSILFVLGTALAFAAGLSMLVAPAAFAQETTGGITGTVKDTSGAVVPRAKVVVTADTLVGSKELETDGSGNYRFANLPAGTYTITVTAAGFKTFKRDGVILEVGHLPSIDLTLEIGTATTVVEVSSQTPQIDVTTNVTQTNVTQDVINEIPHGRRRTD